MRKPPMRSDRSRRTPLFQPNRDEEVRLELEHHRLQLEDELREKGLTPAAARREAARRLDAGATSRTIGAMVRRPLMRRFARVVADASEDIQRGARELLRRPGYSAAMLLALAVGIGGSGLTLSLLDSIFLRPLPVPGIDRVARFYEAVDVETTAFRVSYPSLRGYRERVGRGIEIAGVIPLEVGVASGRRIAEVEAGAVTWNYFATLGVEPQIGRAFVADEEDWDAQPVAVIGAELWRTRFGAERDLVGSTVLIGNHPVTVVGIAPDGFRGLTLDRNEQVWFPVPLLPSVTVGLYANREALESHFVSLVDGVARIPEAMTLENLAGRLAETRVEMFTELGPDVVTEIPEGVPANTARPLAATALGRDEERLRGFVSLIAGLSLFVFVVGTLNALQLRLVRLRQRAGEIGVRRALGASRARLVTQLAADGLLLAIVATGLGVALSQSVLWSLRRFTLPGGVDLARIDPALDWGAMAPLIVVATISVMLASMVPALLGSKQDPALLIRAARRPRARLLLIAAQVALSVALVASAAVFARSFAAGIGTELGFEPDGRVAVTFSPAAHRQVEVEALSERVYAAATTVPGVERVALASHVPLAPSEYDFKLVAVDEPAPDERRPISVNVVLGPFATLMDIPLLQGRDLDVERDRGRRSIVLNEAAADILFPGKPALGRQVKIFDFEPESMEVVGVVANAKALGVTDDAPPLVYVDARNYAYVGYAGAAHLVVAGSAPEAELLRSLQASMADAVPEVLFLDPRRVRTQIVRALMPQHLGMLLFGTFGVTAALLAAIGVAGVIGFELSSRRREVGIRIALGAGGVRAVWPIVGSALAATSAGLVAGLVLTRLGQRWTESMLIETSMLDPVALVGSGLFVVGLVSAAGVAAVLRSGRADPNEFLHEDGAAGRL